MKRLEVWSGSLDPAELRELLREVHRLEEAVSDPGEPNLHSVFMGAGVGDEMAATIRQHMRSAKVDVEGPVLPSGLPWGREFLKWLEEQMSRLVITPHSQGPTTFVPNRPCYEGALRGLLPACVQHWNTMIPLQKRSSLLLGETTEVPAGSQREGSPGSRRVVWGPGKPLRCC